MITDPTLYQICSHTSMSSYLEENENKKVAITVASHFKLHQIYFSLVLRKFI